MANTSDTTRLRLLVAAVSLIPVLTPAVAAGSELLDGTAIVVRLAQPISSENSANGQVLDFVVTQDVVSGNEVLIKRGTRVTGEIVEARRASWKFTHHHHAKLSFKFNHTVGSSGQLIRLRASNEGRKPNCVVVDRYGRHHEVQWAGEGDMFKAYVDGNYVW
jgi:hypothetical protein